MALDHITLLPWLFLRTCQKIYEGFENNQYSVGVIQSTIKYLWIN